MAFHRGADGSDPLRARPAARLHEERRTRSGRLATGTLACPLCDAPVALAALAGPADPLACPYCRHAGAVRDFLSLTAPTRPARVAVRVVLRAPMTA